MRNRVLLAAALLIGGPALAHHSAAMFDRERTVTVSGTVKELQWSSPHCWLQVLSPGDAGPTEWSIEMGAPIELYRGGWRPTILKPGDKITVVFNPTRDGSKGGLYVSATGPDGQPIGKGH
jgi:hypothetical protein